MSVVYHGSPSLHPQKQKIVELFIPIWKESTVNKQESVYMLSGIMLRSGWSVQDVKDVIRAICEQANDASLETRLKVVEKAGKRLPEDKPVPGWPRFRKVFGNEKAGQLEVCLWNPDRPEIDASIQDLSIISPLAWDALKKANQPPRLFLYGNTLSRLELEDDGTPIMRELTAGRLRYELARAARWYVAKTDSVGNTVRNDAKPPGDIVTDMLAHPDPPLPVLYRITEAPVFAPNGSLQLTPGFHEASHTYYSPGDGFRVCDVPEKPAECHVVQARESVDELLSDFPFVSPADRANAVALLLLPFARDLIVGPTPNHSIEAPTAGSGKSLLADVLLRPSVGRNVSFLTQTCDEEECRKRLTALFREARPAIMLDNVKRPLESGVMAGALTMLRWSDRMLGQSTMLGLPIRCVWVTTSNNPIMSGEMARRSIRIRLDANDERPWLREGFRHPNLREWANEHRSRLVWSALTMIQAWVAGGKLKPQIKLLGSYEEWTSVIGGILEVAGIPEFLSNLDEFYEAADHESDGWRILIEVWWKAFGQRVVAVRDLFTLADETDGFELDGNSENARRISFGKQLSRQRDRIIGEYRVMYAGKAQRAARWKLVPGSEQKK